MKITDVQACVIGRQEPDSGGALWQCQHSAAYLRAFVL